MDAQDITDLEIEDEGERAETPVLRLGRGVHDITIRDYLADPCEQPSLRSSDVGTLLHAGLQKFRALHPRFTDWPNYAWRKATKRMDLGSVVHELVLGKGSGFCVLDKTQFKTKAGKPAVGSSDEYKAAVKEAADRGLIVLSPAANVHAQSIADRIAKKLAEHFGAWPIGETERTIIWSEEIVTRDGEVVTIWCRTRPDVLAPELGLVGDLKVTGLGLSDDDLDRTMSGDDGRMFVQSAWQRRGALAVIPGLAGRLHPTTHMFGEPEPPYEVVPVDASQVKLDQANRRCTRAMEIYAAAIARDDWPGRKPTTISGTSWLEARWLEDEGDIETEDES